MFKLLEKIRQKPDRTKKQIAFLTALFIAGFIFVIWLSVIYPDFKRGQAIDDKVAKIEPSPLDTFMNTVKTATGAIGDQVGKIKNVISSIPANFASSTEATTTDNIAQPRQ